MSKRIKLTEDEINAFTEEFKKSLENTKGADGKITISKSLGSVDAKAQVYFTPIAWAKMTILVHSSDKELAWHGLAYRCVGENEEPIPNEYVITDILVYPQKVTGTTVEMDDDKYDPWLMGLDKDTFEGIRMQGHSHVNMATSPSTTDLTWNERILQTVRDDMFYIFMIWNKSLSRNIKIYDVENNIYFDNDDVTVGILNDDGITLDVFLEDAHKMIEAKTYSHSSVSTKDKSINNVIDKSECVTKNKPNKSDDYWDYTEYYSRYGWSLY